MSSLRAILPRLIRNNNNNKFKRRLSIVRQIVRSYWTAQINENRDVVSLKDSASERLLEFPSIWLRDNCQCEQCFDSVTNSRLIRLQNLDTTVRPVSHRMIEENDRLSLFQIDWSDQHRSTFRTDWLTDRSFNSQRQSQWLLDEYRPVRIPWNASDYETIISKFSYQSLLTSDRELLKFLSNLDVYGLVIVQDAGSNRERLKELVRHIGFEKKTFYGDYYLVESKRDTTNLAYRSHTLQLHIDLSYFEYCPGVNMLHYIVQADDEDEGVNQLVCGINACNELKERYPEYYKVLSRIPVEWVDVGKDSGYQFHMVNHAPIICDDESGNILRVNFNQAQRDSQFCVSINDAIEWYKAMEVFVNILHSPENLVSLKMKQGDILAFDNRRILHGRSAFNSERCVLGMYMDWDIIRSKIRVLKFRN